VPIAKHAGHAGDAANEPALVLTDNTALINSTNAYTGKLITLPARSGVFLEVRRSTWYTTKR